MFLLICIFAYYISSHGEYSFLSKMKTLLDQILHSDNNNNKNKNSNSNTNNNAYSTNYNSNFDSNTISKYINMGNGSSVSSGSTYGHGHASSVPAGGMGGKIRPMNNHENSNGVMDYGMASSSSSSNNNRLN